VHSDGKRYVQVRGGRKVWFKKWGTSVDYLVETGEIAPPGTAGIKTANEIIVFREPSIRSSYYGIPGWYSAVAWIMLALAARDYNIMFFQNNREPRWLIILENLDVDDDVDELLRRAFRQDLANSPHKSMIVPLVGKEGKIHIHRMSDIQTDMGFEKLLDICKMEEFPDIYTGWIMRFNELDLTEELVDVEKGITLFDAWLLTVDEGRTTAGYEPLDPETYGDLGRKFKFELGPTPVGSSRQLPTSLFGGNGNGNKPLAEDEKQQLFVDTVARVDQAVNDLLFQKSSEILAGEVRVRVIE
jgi:hypothetical protein